ncbi:MAG: hypothetical protein RM368_33190 [Nostoc sp. DedSLP03]|nr:hypothetical protein [Nostoc sp. DedSLP03]MDZ7969747.1 hypothetical protein [Nostoc sp. DedSLP03]
MFASKFYNNGDQLIAVVHQLLEVITQQSDRHFTAVDYSLANSKLARGKK